MASPQEQLFFLGFARIWGTSARPEYERMTVTVDPHPLPRFRVNGPAFEHARNFKRRFSCQTKRRHGSPSGRTLQNLVRKWKFR